jgi:hypothetical protein
MGSEDDAAPVVRCSAAAHRHAHADEDWAALLDFADQQLFGKDVGGASTSSRIQRDRCGEQASLLLITAESATSGAAGIAGSAYPRGSTRRSPDFPRFLHQSARHAACKTTM